MGPGVELGGKSRAGRVGLDGLNAAQVADCLGLVPHREGGYFRETYRSPILTPTPIGARSLSTSILYLLTADDPSRFHRLRFDELWFFHAGTAVEMVLLDPLEIRILEPGTPQTLVPGGRWMAARIAQPEACESPVVPREPKQELALGGVASVAVTENGSPGEAAWALVGCVVSPGFEYDDFQPGHRAHLLEAYPEAAVYIRTLVDA